MHSVLVFNKLSKHQETQVENEYHTVFEISSLAIRNILHKKGKMNTQQVFDIRVCQKLCSKLWQ